jgi:hypothetical protein
MADEIVPTRVKKKTAPAPVTPGAVVWLKSGSVRLVVHSITEKDDVRYVTVAWCRDGAVMRDTFPEYMLTTVHG